MRPCLKYLLPLLFALNASAQVNLVNNGGFEEYSNCPDEMGQLTNCTGWSNAVPDVDYFNICAPQNTHGAAPQNYFGYAMPHQGNGYIGLCAGDHTSINTTYPGREWAKGYLIDTLINGEFYSLSFYITKSDNYEYSTNNMGIYLSKTSLDSVLCQCSQIDIDTMGIDYNFVFNITEAVCDTSEWNKYSFLFKAKGGEKYVYLGNFYTDALTQYNKCYEKPNSATGYDRFAYYFIDDIELYLADSLNSLSDSPTQETTLFPNPATNTLTISTGNIQNTQAVFYDISGRILFQQNLTASQQSIDLSGFSSGLYICAITQNGQVVKREKVLISH